MGGVTALLHGDWRALAEAADAPRDKMGRIRVEPGLTVPGHPKLVSIQKIYTSNSSWPHVSVATLQKTYGGQSQSAAKTWVAVSEFSGAQPTCCVPEVPTAAKASPRERRASLM